MTKFAVIEDKRGKRIFVEVMPGRVLHTHRGILKHDDIARVLDGETDGTVVSHLGEEFEVLKPRMVDLLMNMQRRSQIIYPKDAAYILLILGIENGSRVIEAGAGSGRMTTYLAWAVADKGKVYSYEIREDMLQVARDVVKSAGYSETVEFFVHNIANGFYHNEVDALFLDLKEPWNYFEQAYNALKKGGRLATLVPTANQVIKILDLSKPLFKGIEVFEILLREYKPISERLRPKDTMVGHTGYIVSARK